MKPKQARVSSLQRFRYSERFARQRPYETAGMAGFRVYRHEVLQLARTIRLATISGNQRYTRLANCSSVEEFLPRAAGAVGSACSQNITYSTLTAVKLVDIRVPLFLLSLTSC